MKREILLQILEITKKQNNAIKIEDTDAFHVLLEERQKQIEALEVLHQAKPELKEQKEEVLLKEIIALDTENVVAYKKLFEEVKDKLNDMRARKRVNNVYNNPYTMGQEEGIFFDKR